MSYQDGRNTGRGSSEPEHRSATGFFWSAVILAVGLFNLFVAAVTGEWGYLVPAFLIGGVGVAGFVLEFGKPSA